MRIFYLSLIALDLIGVGFWLREFADTKNKSALLWMGLFAFGASMLFMSL